MSPHLLSSSGRWPPYFAEPQTKKGDRGSRTACNCLEKMVDATGHLALHRFLQGALIA